MKKILAINIMILLFLSCDHQDKSDQSNADSLTSEELKVLIDNDMNDYLLIDVRKEEEYQSGHIPTAINIIKIANIIFIILLSSIVLEITF